MSYLSPGDGYSVGPLTQYQASAGSETVEELKSRLESSEEKRRSMEGSRNNWRMRAYAAVAGYALMAILAIVYGQWYQELKMKMAGIEGAMILRGR